MIKLSRKRSIFNHPITLDDGKVAIFNTFNSSLVILEPEEYQEFETSSANDLLMPKWDPYEQAGLIVPVSTDERSIVDYDRGNQLYRPAKASFRILTTTKCNAQCRYCYEKGIPVSTMNLDTAKKTVEFIKTQSKGCHQISIMWFGGEPLLNIAAIEHITELINSDKALSSIPVEYSMTTNGSLFTEALIKKASNEWNLKRVQISLDGPKDAYRAIKRYTDGTQLETVINNISALARAGVFVSVRLNYDRENYSDIRVLVEELADKFYGCPNIEVYCYPLFSNNIESDLALDNSSCDLTSLIKTSGLRTVDKVTTVPHYRTIGCFSCASRSFIVLPDGSLGKCARLTSEDNIIGSVYDSQILSSSKYTRWTTPSLPEECQKCDLTPICQGGCRAEQLLGGKGCCLEARTLDYRIKQYIKNLAISAA